MFPQAIRCSTPSSNGFDVAFRPDRPLFRRVQLAAAAALAAGVAIVLHLPLPWPWRAIAALAWCGMQLAELAAWSRAAGGWRLLHFAAGGVRCLCDNGIWCDLSPRAGSLVTPRFAWLRFADGDGRPVVAVLRASSAPAPAWRRLRAWHRAGR